MNIKNTIDTDTDRIISENNNLCDMIKWLKDEINEIIKKKQKQ